MPCTHHCDAHFSCLSHVPIFDGLSEEDRMEIARSATSREYAKGEMVYTAGEEGGRLYVLYTGRAKVFRLNPSGREQVIRMVEPGDFIGELSLLSSLPLSDNVQVTKRTTMCMVDGRELKALMARNPNIAFKVMDELSRRLEKAETSIETISLGSVSQRLAQALIEGAQDGGELHLKMTRGDWASQLGMSQETLSRKLSAWQEEGLIEQKSPRRILIKDRATLEELTAE